jgi:predicted transposase YdaD
VPLTLPDELQEDFREELYQFEEAKRMPYVTSIERMAIKKGREEWREKGREEGRKETLLKAIAAVLNRDFGVQGQKLLPRFRAVHDVAKLEELMNALFAAESIEEARALVRS